MITSVLKIYTLNFSLVVFLILVFFFVYQIQDASWTNSLFVGSKLGLLAARVSIYNQLYFEENGLSKDSAYTVFFIFLLIVFFPSVLDNVNLVVANFFILLAFRRLISLQSLKASKEKILMLRFGLLLLLYFNFGVFFILF
jgi:hypothetical protein